MDKTRDEVQMLESLIFKESESWEAQVSKLKRMQDELSSLGQTVLNKASQLIRFSPSSLDSLARASSRTIIYFDAIVATVADTINRRKLFKNQTSTDGT